MREERCLRCGWAAGHLDAQQYRPDLQGWAPLVLQDIQTDAAEPVNVRMVNFGQEPDLVRAAAQAVSRSGWLRSGGGGACTRQPVQSVARRDGPSAAPWDTPRARRAPT